MVGWQGLRGVLAWVFLTLPYTHSKRYPKKMRKVGKLDDARGAQRLGLVFVEQLACMPVMVGPLKGAAPGHLRG